MRCRIIEPVADLRDRLQSALGPAYQLRQELGGGGMSRVFLADEVRLGRSVVVKVLPPELGGGVNVERFEREIALAAKLQHPHIVPLLTAGSHEDLLYYVMPHIAGRSLRARLAQERELPVGETVRILRDVCDALAHAHAHHIVHRDIKPDNVLLSGRHALVTDFGVAKAVQESTGKTALTSLGVALGTPAYMAPEQAAADPHTDHRADIYAAGALAYEMLAGQPPFAGPSVQAVLAAQVSTQPDPVTKYRDSVPPALVALVMRCLAKHPADRWQSATELLEQLDQMATPSGGVTPTASAPYDAHAAGAARRAHPVRVAALFTAASAAVLALVYLARQLLGLPDWVLPGAAVLLGLGLPIMVATGLVERRRVIARSTGAAPAGAARGWRRLMTWRAATAGGVLAFAALGIAVAGYMGMRVLGIGPVGTLVASGALEARDRLVLAEFDNRTGDSTLGLSVGEAFRIDLAQSPLVRLVDQAAVDAALQRMNRPSPPGARLALPLARELAQREGAKAVVRGRIDPVGRGYVLAAELVSAADGAVLVALRENARDDGAIIEAVDRLSKRLRERIGESLRSIRASESLERVTTGSLEALRRYTQAIRAEDRGAPEEAIALLEEALALDTSFAMAYRKLAVVLSNAFAARSRQNAAAASAFRHRDRLPPLERHLATAYYYDQVEYDPPRIERAYRAALELDPENDIAANNLALHWNETRRFAAAESLSMRYLRGTGAPIYMNAARALLGQGKLDAATEVIRVYERNAPEHPFLDALKAFVAENREEFDSAETYMEAQRRSRRDLSVQARSAGHLLALAQLRGRLGAAEREARRFMEVAEQRGLPAAYVQGAVRLGLMRLRFEDAPGAARQGVEAALARHPLETIPVEDRPYAALAAFLAEAGQPARARRLLEEYEAAVPEGQRRAEPERHGAAGSIAFAEGRLDDAISAYRAWYDESACTRCGLYELAAAYDRAGARDSAVAIYERALRAPDQFRVFQDALSLPLAYRRLGELYEQRGDLDNARAYYARFVELWKDADPALQPAVREVRARLGGLARERPAPLRD